MISFVGISLKDFIQGSKLPPKYSFLRDLISKGEASIFVSDNFSSFSKRIKNKFLLKFIFFFETYILKYFEIYIWLIINKCFLKTKVIFNFKSITDEDVLILFSNILLDSKHPSTNIETLKKLKCKKIIHLSHYIHNTSIISKNVEDLNNYYFAFENNLKNNSPYFKKHFNYNKDFLQLVYGTRSIFKIEKNFEKREKKAVSIGSFQIYDNSYIDDTLKDCHNFYKTSTNFPIRKDIYEDQNNLREFIICYNTKIDKNNDYRKGPYFKFNINKMFNNFQMFICAEELGDAPGVSFAEGMKCGTVFIGKDSDCYKDIGMKDGYNYISYKNGLDEIIDKINFYQKNYNKLQNISKNGHSIAIEKFNSGYVQKLLLEFCKKI